MSDEEGARALLGTAEGARLAQESGIAHLLITPLIQGNGPLGYLWIASTSANVPLTDESISFATETARVLTTAISHMGEVKASQGREPAAKLLSLRLRAILDTIPQGLVLVDVPEGKVVLTNKSLDQLIGRQLTPEAWLSSDPQRFGLLHANGFPYNPGELPWVRTARTSSPVHEEEMTISRPDGLVLTVLCSSSPILAEDGTLTGAIAVLIDITERKEFERQKDEFLAMVSHELRTPLASIKGSTQFLQRRMQTRPGVPLGKTETDMLQIMDQQVNRLIRLVSDLTQYSIIQVGRLELFRRKFDLSVLASDVLQHAQAAAPGYDLQLSVRGNAGVNADPDRIEQVLYNLITNAVKAPRTGKRAVKPLVEVRILENEDGTILTSVHDDGVGVNKNIHDLIFQRLYRGPERSHEGMGLGLYISKGIIDAHGGRIWFESEEGKGTTFYFTLPAARQDAVPQARAS